MSATLDNVLDKIKILHSYKTHPVTFEIEELEQKLQSSVEKFYSNYYKYALGISKYSSSTLNLSELGRHPIRIRATVLRSIMYWLRFEHGPESTMLNNAFVSMKAENSKWLNKVEYLLWKIGLRGVWLNPHHWDKKKV